MSAVTGRLAVHAVEMEDHCVVSIAGELDAATVQSLRERLDELTDRGWRRLIVDAAKIRIVEFSGVEVLLQILSRLRQQGTQITLSPSDRGAYKVLHRIGAHLKS